jgi:AcrR family transcriptional regulator
MDYSPLMAVPDDSGLRSTYEVLRASPPRERADAARNRVAVLDAAERLFREQGVDGVSMDAIAAAARVGKGTLFRRFGDKAGLAAALLDERERELQQAILSGPPPLGPGAPAAQRLRAFFAAYLDYVLAHLDLSRMSENASPGARYRIGAYRFWRHHVTILLRELAPERDPEALAHTLLATVSAEHLIAVTAELGPKRATDAILDAVERIA